MTKQVQHLTHQDVSPHIGTYMLQSFPVDGKDWTYKWYYHNGTNTVQITLTIDGETAVHHVPVLCIVASASK